MDTNLPPPMRKHVEQLNAQRDPKKNLDNLLKGSIGTPETTMTDGKNSLKITYPIPEGLQHPYTNVLISNLVRQYKEMLGVQDGVSPGEIENSGNQSTVTITLTGEAHDKMEALQKLAEKQPSGCTP